MFDNNFGKHGPIFKILSAVIRKKIIYVHITKISTSPAICCYVATLPCESRKFNSIFMLNVTMFN